MFAFFSDWGGHHSGWKRAKALSKHFGVEIVGAVGGRSARKPVEVAVVDRAEILYWTQCYCEMKSKTRNNRWNKMESMKTECSFSVDPFYVTVLIWIWLVKIGFPKQSNLVKSGHGIDDFIIAKIFRLPRKIGCSITIDM